MYHLAIEQTLTSAFGQYVVYVALPNQRCAAIERTFRCWLHNQTQPNLSHSGRRPTQVTFDAAAMPFADSSVDVVVLDGALALHNSPLDVLRECMRVLVAGGQLVIADQERYSLTTAIAMVKKMVDRLDQSWSVPGFALATLAGWLNVLGFEVCELKPVRTAKWRYADQFISSVQAQLVSYRLPASGHYLVRAVKRESRMTLINDRKRFHKMRAIGPLETQRSLKSDKRD